MKIKKGIAYEITATEGKRYLTLSFADGTCFNFDSNLPHEKKVDDWKFLGKAVLKIVKVLEKG